MAVDFNKLRNERYDDLNRLYIIISGDREFKEGMTIFLPTETQVVAYDAKEVLFAYVDKLLTKNVERGRIIRIVTGDNRGVDTLAEDYGCARDYDVYVFEAHWNELGSKAGYDRNEELFFFVGRRPNKAAVLFWNGENPYTLNLIYQAYLFNTPIRVYNYVQKRWLKADEVNLIQMEEHRKQMSYKSNGGTN